MTLVKVPSALFVPTCCLAAYPSNPCSGPSLLKSGSNPPTPLNEQGIVGLERCCLHRAELHACLNSQGRLATAIHRLPRGEIDFLGRWRAPTTCWVRSGGARDNDRWRDRRIRARRLEIRRSYGRKCGTLKTCAVPVELLSCTKHTQ